MAATATLVGKMAWDDSAFNRGLKSSGDRLKTFGSSAKGMIGAALGGFAVAGIARRVFSVTDALDDIGKKARIAGVEVEAFQRQSQAFEKADIPIENYVKAMSMITRRTEDAIGGSVELQKAFGDLNIEIDAFKSLAPEDRILKLADAYKDANDKQRAFSALFAIMGRDAAKFTDAFKGGAAEINAAGAALKNVVDQETIDKIEELNDAWSDLKLNMRNATVKGGVGISKFMGKALGGLYLATKSGDEREKLKDIMELGFGSADEKKVLVDGGMSQEKWEKKFREQRAGTSLMTESGRARVAHQSFMPSGFATPSALDNAPGKSSGFVTKSLLDEMRKQTSVLEKTRDDLRKNQDIKRTR